MEPNDWRLSRQQEKYLAGALLIGQPYRPTEGNDHDHCEFCWDKFYAGEGCLHWGYSTPDRYIWICPQCFEDFKAAFGWRVQVMQEGSNGGEV